MELCQLGAREELVAGLYRFFWMMGLIASQRTGNRLYHLSLTENTPNRIMNNSLHIDDISPKTSQKVAQEVVVESS